MVEPGDGKGQGQPPSDGRVPDRRGGRAPHLPQPPPTGAEVIAPPPGHEDHGFPSPPARRGMSTGGKITLWVLLAVLVLGGLFVAAVVADRVLFSSRETNDFSLRSSPVFQDALQDIKRYYFKQFSEDAITRAAEKAVEQEKEKGVDNQDELLNAGLAALVKALGDQHSGYLTPSENRRLGEDLSGSFFGVGFTLRNDEESDRPKVVTVIKGSPADRAGIKAEDIVTTVDDKDTRGEPLDAVVLRIRGRKGTDVKIRVLRAGKPMEFRITREKIDIPDFESEMVDGNIGVIRLFEFNSGAGDKVRAAVRDLEQKGAKGFILDLRNNPGGLLDEAVKVTSVFLDEGPVVSYKTKGDRETVESASGGAETRLPLVVLTNEGSASSSEIAAGALKDRGRATLVGAKTYGKGSVQKVFELDNRGAAKLTIALYFLPDGESIDGTGIEPDVVVPGVKDDPEQTARDQFDKARQVLNNLIQGKPATGRLLLPAA